MQSLTSGGSGARMRSECHLSRRASWDSIALEKEVPVQRSSSESDFEILTNKRNFPPVPVKKSKLSLLRKFVPHKYSTRSQVDLKQTKLLEVGEPNPQAIGKQPSAWERAKSCISNSPSLLARIISFRRSADSASESDVSSNASISAGILPNPSVGLTPLLPANFSEPPYSSSRIFAAAEEFLSDAPSVSDGDHPSVAFAGSHLNSVHSSQRSDESIRRSYFEPVDSAGTRALPTDIRPQPERSISYRNQNAEDQLVDSSERSVRLPEYGTGNEASGVQLVGGSNEARPFFTAPFHSVFPSHSNVFRECAPISNTRDNTSGVFLRKSIACRARESENFLFPSQPLSRDGNTGVYPKHPFPGGSEPHDSIHFESEAGIQLHQYPRQGFKHRQSPRPSETSFGRSHRLHLSAAGKIVLAPASGDDQESRSSSDSQRSVKFHSIPPVSTVDGLHNKSRFSTVSGTSSPARDRKTASVIRTSRPPSPIDANVVIKPDPNSLSNISLPDHRRVTGVFDTRRPPIKPNRSTGLTTSEPANLHRTNSSKRRPPVSFYIPFDSAANSQRAVDQEPPQLPSPNRQVPRLVPTQSNQ